MKICSKATPTPQSMHLLHSGVKQVSSQMMPCINKTLQGFSGGICFVTGGIHSTLLFIQCEKYTVLAHYLQFGLITCSQAASVSDPECDAHNCVKWTIHPGIFLSPSSAIFAPSFFSSRGLKMMAHLDDASILPWTPSYPAPNGTSCNHILWFFFLESCSR